jgi:hypothetical protein
MADEQNKNNKPPMNGGFGVSEIEKIGQQAYTVPKVEQEQRERASRARVQIEAFAELPEEYILKNKVLSKYAKTAPNTLMSAEERIKSSVSSRLERSNVQAANAVGRDYAESTINSLTRQGYEDPAFQNKALTMMNTPYESLAKRRQEISGQIGALGAQSVEAAGAVFSNRGPRKDLTNQIAGNAEQANSLVKELTSIDLAMKTKRQTGSDPLSKFEKLNATGKSAEDLLSARSIGEELSKGGVDIKGKNGGTVNVATGDINKALTQEAENLKRALTDLATTTETSKDKLDEMRKSAETSAENFEKLSKAAGQGGGGNRDTVGYLNAAAGGFNAIGSAGQQIMINQRMQQVSNIGGFAGLANQQYDMYTKARGGDIASQLALGQVDKAEDFGAEMKNATNIVQGAQAAGAAAQTTAGVIQTSEAVGQKFNPLAYATGSSTQNTAALQQGALNVVQGGANLAVVGSDVLKGASAQSNRLAGIQAQMQARQAINQVGAQQAQGLRDFYTGLDVVGQDMGGKASDFIEKSRSGENLQKMQDARMSPEQFLQMSKAGASQMGSTFDTEQVFAARNLEARGFGSKESNMQRMSQLASAGANNPKEGMESVLSAAMTKGLDSSKAINMMVENTAAMVQSSAGAAVGIDTTKAASSQLANSMNPEMKNKEFALQQAMSAQEMTKQQTTNRDVSFIGMANTAGLQQNLQKQGINIGGTEAIIAQGFDMATLKSFKDDKGKFDSAKASKFFQNQGVNVSEKDAEKFVSTTLEEKEKQILRPAGVALNADTEGLRKRIKAGNLTDADNVSLGQIASLSGRKGGADEVKREILGVNAPNVSGAVGKDLTEGKGPDDIKKQMDTLRTSGFKQLSEAAAFASTNLEKFGGALKVFTDLTQKYEKGGTKNEETFSTAASDFAKDFGASTNLFKGSVGQFEAAVKILSTKAGLDSNRNPVKPTFMDNKDEQKGSTRGNSSSW